MQRLILLTFACIALSYAAEPKTEPEGSETRPLLYYPKHQELLEPHDIHDEDDSRHEFRGVLNDDNSDHHKYSYTSQHIRGHRYNSKERKIIESVYSPDYYEPTLILDFRYLKSGGRDYVRGPGGQILILPKNVHSGEHKEHHDYDSLIEYLRLRNLAKSRDDDNLGIRRSHGHNGHQQQNHELPWY